MIKIENVVISGVEAAVRGMRNPMNSWDKSDSAFYVNDVSQIRGTNEYYPVSLVSVGQADMNLMKRLASNGPVHAKYRRFITVTMDITAPLYWWKEFDTYKVGTVANSCSTIHKIADKPFELDDFSHDKLMGYPSCDDECTVDVCEKYRYYDDECNGPLYPAEIFSLVVDILNAARDKYNETKDKRYWWQMIQLLPSSYNQKRTVLLNYEVLSSIYSYRKDHKLDEWREFCEWIETLPLAEGVIFQKDDKEEDE
jgi:hypothetical protein